MYGEPSNLRSFALWFQSHEGFVDASVMDITTFPGHCGRGAIALTDIPEGHTLFTIPRSLTLSTRTSSVPAMLGPQRWKNYGLDKGWVGLILCMMWEEAQGASSKWSQYMSDLPMTFDTPMFWSASELEELKGTSVVDKIGRDDAERDYYTKLLPAVHSRQDLFSPNLIPQYYSLEKYHIHGSRILSRSFQVERWEGKDGTIEDNAEGDTSAESEMDAANMSAGSGMDVDEGPADASQLDESENSDDEDADDPSDVAMVPMADMLNARYGSANAKLFYDENLLRMITTKPIKAGEQIWNTYGDPPNSDLLRKYGHVDTIPLSQGGEGNPSDIVEVRADLLVSVITQQNHEISSESTKERIDWWLEEGGDDVFVLETNLELPDALISMIRLLLLLDGEWAKARDKGKAPKPKVDPQLLSLVLLVLRNRLEEYPTSLEFDVALLSENIPLTRRHAVIVRVGEKQILRGTIEKLLAMQQALLANADKDKGKKRKGGSTPGEATERPKKAKR